MEYRRLIQDIGSATYTCVFDLDIVDSKPCRAKYNEVGGLPDTRYLFVLLVYLQIDVSESLRDSVILT